MSSFLALMILQAAAQAAFVDPDTDHDGLSDFQEVHKYGTDPARADSDGDGIPDGDWNERREYAYSVRSILQVLPPCDPESMNDDYQDARLLERRSDCVEVEVIHYPLNTNAAAIVADREWRAHVAGLKAWIEPGITTNWDDALRRTLVEELAAKGLDASKASDLELVVATAKLAMDRAQYDDSFTTFTVDFTAGKPRIAAGLEDFVQGELAKSKRTLAEQWDRELFGRGMFEHRVHGACTSSAIYLATGLKALGIPARTIVCMPVIDASDEREIELVKRRITNHVVRDTILRAARRAGHSWTSHTFNEVYVGGRWQRLNYTKLGQNTLDANYLGLMTHVLTFRDHAEAGLSPWGVYQVRRAPDSAFEGPNPYSCISLSDSFGAHARIENPEVRREHETLTIERAYWWDDPSKSAGIDMDLRAPPGAGHLLVHVVEGTASSGTQQYEDFYAAVAKDFVLRAPGRNDVHAHAMRGYWFDPAHGVQDFYLRLEPDDFAAMVPGIAYALVAPPAHDGCAWKIQPGVEITRRQP